MGETTESQIQELKLEILKKAEEAMNTAVKTGDSAMVAAVAEIVRSF
ncbi:hypothetical protein [Enterococcus casseliflavus]